MPGEEDARMRDLQEIEAKLKENKDLLDQKFNVREIGIFGSFVRGEQKETSDLDILVEFKARVSLFEIVRLERFLSELLGEKVDLVLKKSLKPRIGKHILKEVVYV
jgi:predicted nucleotidyltransferase